MTHVQLSDANLPEEFVIRVTGRYYTHEAVASHLLQALIEQLRGIVNEGDVLSVCDPSLVMDA